MTSGEQAEYTAGHCFICHTRLEERTRMRVEDPAGEVVFLDPGCRRKVREVVRAREIGVWEAVEVILRRMEAQFLGKGGL